MFRHFVLLYENNAISIPGLRGCPSIYSGIYAVLYIDVIFHISQTSSKFGQRQLVMKYNPCDLSRSEIPGTARPAIAQKCSQTSVQISIKKGEIETEIEIKKHLLPN